MKRIFCAVCALILLFSMTGCGQKEEPKMVEKLTENGTVYDGEEQRLYQLEEGQTGNLSVTVTGNKGTLALSVTKDGESFYESGELKNCGFSVALDEPGEYCCLITADCFAGEYDLEWSTEE